MLECPEQHRPPSRPGYMHDYDIDLAERTHTRTFAEEEAHAFSAMDCALNGEKGVYASSELTTGRRAYDLVQERQATLA